MKSEVSGSQEIPSRFVKRQLSGFGAALKRRF